MAPTEGRLSWRSVAVAGRTASYGEAGTGVPVVFAHGWGLSDHAYKRPLGRLARRGCRVVAPALPGFGRTQQLPPTKRSMRGYADWMEAFISQVVDEEPVIVIGHSFGGGVAIQYAHDHAWRVRHLVLVNSVGGAARTSASSRRGQDHLQPAQRPSWNWGLGFARELLPTVEGMRLAATMQEDFVKNVVRNPRTFFDVGKLARTTNLRAELTELRRRGLPVLALQGQADGVIPRAAFEALCAAVGSEGQVLPGNHSWLLADPDAFDQVLANVITAASASSATAGSANGDGS